MSSHVRWRDRVETPVGVRAAVGIALGLSFLLSFLGSCQSTDNNTAQATSPPAAASNEGSFSIALTLGGGFKFASVAYDVSGNGFHRAGSIDVGGSSVLSTVIGAIPFGTGYTLQLTAQDADGKLMPCTGSAAFDITSAATVSVPVHLTCHQVATTTPPPSVPVPAWARFALAALLLGAGASLARGRDRRLG
jgi:hypothetical protein